MLPIINKLSKRFLSKKSLNFKRYLYYEIDFNARVIGIIGGRGSGKTTLIHQYAKNSKFKNSEILYISCDHPSLSDIDIFEVADEFYIHGGKLLLLDEIHKIKNFSSYIKSIYDFTNLQIIFSGSSAMTIEHQIGDLSRRAVIYHLSVLSFREFLALSGVANLQSYTLEDIINHHEDITIDILEHIQPLKYFKEYLEYGAYPFFKEGKSSYLDRLIGIVNTTIDSDLASIFNINSDKLNILKKVLYMLCSTSPYEISKSKLSASVNISWSTLSKYLDYMQKGALINIVRVNRGFKTLNSSDKILLNNPNLFNVLCAVPNIGSIRESFFVSQLNGHQINYFNQGDFLIDEKYVFEIGGKSKDSSQIKDIKNGYLVIDDIESGYLNKIPLWLFGFLY